MGLGALGTAAVASAAIGAGSGLIGAGMQSSAIKSAQGQQNALMQQQRADLAPWRTTGTTANTTAADLLGINGQAAADTAMAGYQTSPGYQFQLEQGLRAVDAGAAAKGMLRSGATLKAEQTFGQGLADSDFTAYYNRLMGLSQQGVGAAAGNASTTNTGISQAGIAGAENASIYGNTAAGISNVSNALLNNKGVQNWLTGGAAAETGGWD